ncbi:MAG: biotin--[acetyl-CoA-carboxylase] ligase [Lachnospiraceae bacterium]|nr:biotin--[acetyl-CoA-carboxylase] ligase [Lachnospiraceae bacterium]MEE1015101.1 biotin--[acetyl-CoA-carboxylase] ligase [Lachnospiraceae bacterium]
MRNLELEQLETAWAGKTCLCFDSMESTQNYGKELGKKEPVHGTLILAEEQTAGRGRRGRSWQSEKGANIAMSLCLEPKLRTEHAAGLTLVMALAVAEGIKKVTGREPQIKWPNDIVLNGRKICGILTEMCFKDGGYIVVIGVGINVNNTGFPEDIKGTASSLKLETGAEISREALIASVMECFENYYEIYEQTEDLALLKEQYESMLANKNREVNVLDPKEPYKGTAKGINSAGNLIVVCEDGTEKEVYSGEVSVRGIYGYV